MNKTTMTFAALVTSMFLGSSSRASAQTAVAETAFVNFNVGGQVQSRDIATNSNVELYGETATFATSQKIGSGAVFEISGGYRINPTFAVAVGVSRFSNSSTGALAASIPNPLAFNSFTVVNVEQTGLKHTEIGTNIMAVYFVPITVKFDVMLSAGPSFTRLKQDIPTATLPVGTTTPTIAVTTRSATAAGVNIGGAANYLMTPRYGATAFIRYVSGSADIPEADGLKVGGFQIGLGAHVRF
jgi:hypothetical protein